LPVSEGIVEQTYEDHFVSLTREDPGNDSVIRDILSDRTFKKVLDEVRDAVRGALLGGEFEDNSSYLLGRCQRFAPSTSACFEYSRGQGGQQGFLTDLVGITDPLTDELVSMEEIPVAISNKKWSFNKVVENRCPAGLAEWSHLRSLGRACLDEKRRNKCTIQAVLEPMKVRVISKAEAMPHYIVKPLQKILHSSLRGMAPFRLIGRPFCPTDLIDLTERSAKDDEWFSIDYSAATDGLSWKYSSKILEFVLQDLPQCDRDLAFRVLGPHDLYYPRSRKEMREIKCFKPSGEKFEDDFSDLRKKFRGVQRNGQLMGSVLSFPILCLANLGVYLRTTRELHRDWDNEDRLKHVLVNGDDMLYTAPVALWKNHISNGEAVGLKMSIGKAYHHPTYANVNSTSVHYKIANSKSFYTDSDSKDEFRFLRAFDKQFSTPWQIDFLNVGLFYGQSKVQMDDKKKEREAEEVVVPMSRFLDEDEIRTTYARSHKSIDLMGSNHTSRMNALMKGALPGRGAVLAKMFLARHAVDIQHETTTLLRTGSKIQCVERHLFMPNCVGGMGIEPIVGLHRPIKKIHRIIAKAVSRSTEIESVDDIVDALTYEDLEEREAAMVRGLCPVALGKPRSHLVVMSSFPCLGEPVRDHLITLKAPWEKVVQIKSFDKESLGILGKGGKGFALMKNREQLTNAQVLCAVNGSTFILKGERTAQLRDYVDSGVKTFVTLLCNGPGYEPNKCETFGDIYPAEAIQEDGYYFHNCGGEFSFTQFQDHNGNFLRRNQIPRLRSRRSGN
jgi:hypothetical protein